MGATPLGFGSPTSFPTPSLIPGLSPYGGVSANPFSQLQSQSPMQVPGVVAPYASHALLQTQQALQAAVQQLQQLLQIEYLKQQQLQQLHYLVQQIPVQLAQLQQQIQIAQQSQQQPFVPAGIAMSPLWSTSQIGAQPNYLM
jgi:hypothetical protein